MKSWKVIAFCVCLVGLTLVAVGRQNATSAAAQSSQGTASDPYSTANDPYEVVPGWPEPLGDLDWSRSPSVFAESPNRVYVAQTGQLPRSFRATRDPAHPNWPFLPFPDARYCQQPGLTCTPGQGQIIFDKKPIPGSRWAHIVNVFDANGKLIESWEQHNDKWVFPHGLMIDPSDPERHVWTVDNVAMQVLKFTHDGKKLVMAVGVFKNMRNNVVLKHDDFKGEFHFALPQGIAFGANGEFYVADGGDHGRVVKFSKDGKVLLEFGKTGTGPGEFGNLPDSLDVDSQGRIYVIDYGGRIQVFDKAGKYIRGVSLNLEEGTHPHSLALSKDEEQLYAVIGGTEKPSAVRTYATGDLRLVRTWSRPIGGQPGQMWGSHDFGRDSDGNIYIGESYGGRVQKFRPKRGADPSLLFRPVKKNTFQ